MSLNRGFIFSIAVAGIFSLGFFQTASAAIFDTIDSVETLQKVAAQNKKSDRLPASESAKSSDAKDGSAVAPSTETVKPAQD